MKKFIKKKDNVVFVNFKLKKLINKHSDRLESFLEFLDKHYMKFAILISIIIIWLMWR